jgi:hypothetical protein
MKKINGTVFLIFFVVIILLLFVGVAWIATTMDKELALGIGIGTFLVIVMFAQQILSGIHNNEITQNLVEYDKNQAGIEEGRMKATVVYAQSMRDTAKVQARIDEQQYRQMQIAAQKMAGMLSEAEIARVKAEMNSMGMLVDSSAQTIELD